MKPTSKKYTSDVHNVYKYTWLKLLSLVNYELNECMTNVCKGFFLFFHFVTVNIQGKIPGNSKISWWRFKDRWCLNRFPHSWHLYGFSSVTELLLLFYFPHFGFFIVQITFRNMFPELRGSSSWEYFSTAALFNFHMNRLGFLMKFQWPFLIEPSPTFLALVWSLIAVNDLMFPHMYLLFKFLSQMSHLYVMFLFTLLLLVILETGFNLFTISIHLIHLSYQK